MNSIHGVLKNLKRNPSGESKYDSLLERNYMLELDSMSGVREWTKDHGIRIPYKIFGILPHHYIPDFLITFSDGSRELHETKGAGFLRWLSTHEKRRMADAWCKERGMKYRFIENSKGALFAENRGIDRMERTSDKRL
ncbi:MAG: TnsA endonuclease N-terminal domain-containing protein [Candidatus Vogelbacteria bacterium]|nr:TnsA endonuclease N-terminal domain-containing protein [Candidatus Vogelbacteria bacterium]